MDLMEVLIHFFISLLVLLSIVLISRTVVAGTKYSPILIISMFGMFGKAMTKDDKMPVKAISVCPILGVISVIFLLVVL